MPKAFPALQPQRETLEALPRSWGVYGVPRSPGETRLWVADPAGESCGGGPGLLFTTLSTTQVSRETTSGIEYDPWHRLADFLPPFSTTSRVWTLIRMSQWEITSKTSRTFGILARASPTASSSAWLDGGLDEGADPVAQKLWVQARGVSRL